MMQPINQYLTLDSAQAAVDNQFYSTLCSVARAVCLAAMIVFPVLALILSSTLVISFTAALPMALSALLLAFLSGKADMASHEYQRIADTETAVAKEYEEALEMDSEAITGFFQRYDVISTLSPEEAKKIIARVKVNEELMRLATVSVREAAEMPDEPRAEKYLSYKFAWHELVTQGVPAYFENMGLLLLAQDQSTDISLDDKRIKQTQYPFEWVATSLHKERIVLGTIGQKQILLSDFRDNEPQDFIKALREANDLALQGPGDEDAEVVQV